MAVHIETGSSGHSRMIRDGAIKKFFLRCTICGGKTGRWVLKRRYQCYAFCPRCDMGTKHVTN